MKSRLVLICANSEFSPVVKLPRQHESHQQESEKHESLDGQGFTPQRSGHSDLDSSTNVQQVRQSQL